MRARATAVAALFVALVSCPAFSETTRPESHSSGWPFAFPGAQAEAANFVSVPGWAEDAHEGAFRAFLRSCRQILNAAEPARVAQSVWLAIRDICPAALALGANASRGQARTFFEAHFRPIRLSRLGEADGFLTAYYEPEVAAAREPSETYRAPFLRKPDDLVSAGGGAGFDARSGAGRWVDGRFIPYFDRGEIEAGALDGRGLEIAWARDPADVLFTQIQGSARLVFSDGGVLRIGYHAHNGHRYTPVGRVLVERGIASREQMSMDFIRSWMAENPEAAVDVRRQNRSYVFFHVKSELSPDAGPIGGQGVPVADWRTLAIDRNIHAYGTPIFIDGEMPTGAAGSGEPFRRLMIAQDTGSAIVGVARGDLYLGSGFELGSLAGRIRHRADWYVLLPKALSPKNAAVPVPRERPARPTRNR